MGNPAEDRSGFRIDRISFSGAAGAVVALAGMAILVEGVPALRSAALVAGRRSDFRCWPDLVPSSVALHEEGPPPRRCRASHGGRSVLEHRPRC